MHAPVAAVIATIDGLVVARESCAEAGVPSLRGTEDGDRKEVVRRKSAEVGHEEARGFAWQGRRKGENQTSRRVEDCGEEEDGARIIGVEAQDHTCCSQAVASHAHQTRRDDCAATGRHRREAGCAGGRTTCRRSKGSSNDLTRRGRARSTPGRAARRPYDSDRRGTGRHTPRPVALTTSNELSYVRDL